MNLRPKQLLRIAAFSLATPTLFVGFSSQATAQSPELQQKLAAIKESSAANKQRLMALHLEREADHSSQRGVKRFNSSRSAWEWMARLRRSRSTAGACTTEWRTVETACSRQENGTSLQITVSRSPPSVSNTLRSTRRRLSRLSTVATSRYSQHRRQAR